MATVIENPTTSVQSLDIDARSFHVFQYQGDRLLFDRATGTTCDLNELAFDLLSQIRQGESIEQSIQETLTKHEGTDKGALRQALIDLQARGFFRFTSVQDATEKELESLWRHKPRRIQLLMAEGCNLGCRYCYQWRNGTNQRHTLMPWPIARDSVNHLVWRSGGRTDLQVTFFGGEPLLNYSMVRQVVGYCKSIEQFTDKKFTFELITNGTLLDKEVVDFIVEHEFLLFISLDGWKEMHEYNRPSLTDKDMHETIVKNALYANEQYEKHKLPRVKIRANLTNKYHDSEKVAGYFHSLGFKLIGIGAIEPLPHGNPSPASLTEDQMDELHEQSSQKVIDSLEKLKRGEKLDPYWAKMINKSQSKLSKRQFLGVTCGVARNTTIVDNRGNMYPCHRYAEMKQYSIGNVSTGLNRQKVMEYYRKINGHATENCHDCWIRDYCGGGCAWLLSDKDGVIHDPTLRECSRRQSSMERGLWLRKELRLHFPAWFEDGKETLLNHWDWDVVIDEQTEPNCFEEEGAELPIVEMSDPEKQQEKLPLQNGCGSCQSDCSDDGCSSCGDSGAGGGLVQLVPLSGAYFE